MCCKLLLYVAALLLLLLLFLCISKAIQWSVLVLQRMLPSVVPCEIHSLELSNCHVAVAAQLLLLLLLLQVLSVAVSAVATSTFNCMYHKLWRCLQINTVTARGCPSCLLLLLLLLHLMLLICCCCCCCCRAGHRCCCCCCCCSFSCVNLRLLLSSSSPVPISCGRPSWIRFCLLLLLLFLASHTSCPSKTPTR